jgi:hypothetical protein
MSFAGQIAWIVSRETYVVGGAAKYEIVEVYDNETSARAYVNSMINNGKTSVASTWQWRVEPFPVKA